MDSFWENASPLYRKVVLSGMVFLGVGIILSIVAILGRIQWLTFAAVAIIGIGLVTHVAGVGLRIRDARRRASR